MNGRRVHGYVLLVCVAAGVCLASADWQSLASLPPSSLAGLAGLVAVALVSESVALKYSVGSVRGRSSITFLPLLASVQLFGPVAAVVLAAVTLSFAEFVVRRKGLYKGTFNVAQAVVATTVAGWSFLLLNGVPLEGAEAAAGIRITGQLGPFVAFGLLFLALNHAAVSLAITLSQGLPFRRVWTQVVSNSGASLNDLLISPIALAVAFLYVQVGIGGIVVVILPMLFIRYSYLTTSKLREANEDLLSALVKAIEVRDPYTSGHSQRVSQLARRIADEVGLPRITAERVQMAGLLHDIGKIEAVYIDILSKPDVLTAEERAIIESHVTRGEQLLRDLSSVPEEVVQAVRHHHEREDGLGYPDRLHGPDIPIGAKIIAVCDAIDAMLSDRPYRGALPLTLVMQQLREHSGRQFDQVLVQCVTESNILGEYADMMRAARHHELEVVATASGPSTLPAPPLRRATALWPRRAYN